MCRIPISTTTNNNIPNFPISKADEHGAFETWEYLNSMYQDDFMEALRLTLCTDTRGQDMLKEILEEIEELNN